MADTRMTAMVNTPAIQLMVVVWWTIYLIVSSDIQDKITHFSIQPLTHYSDHCPLVFSLQKNQPTEKNCIPPIHTFTFQTPE